MDAFQQLRRRFVGGILGDELAGEGAGEEGGRDPAKAGRSNFRPRFNLVGQRKRIAVVYPGPHRHALASRVEAVPLAAVMDGMDGLFPEKGKA